MKYLSEETYKEDMEKTVLPYLETRRKDGFFASFDGNKLHYVAYTDEKADRTVVVLHGFTESAEKYAEMAYYLLLDGANVFLLEQRGHGKSFRYVEDTTLTHVERFEDYVADAECFLDTVVPKDKPLRLYAHSMGGAVAALLMEKHPDMIEKAVLSSPMIAPARAGVPLWVVKAVCRGKMLIGGSKQRFFTFKKTEEAEKFDDSYATSEARFDRYNEIKSRVTVYKNNAPTYRWTLESMNVTKKILAKGAPERIGTEILLFSAGNDTVVLIPPQKAFVERLKHGRFVTVPDAKHEIFLSKDRDVTPYFDELLAFLK